MSTHISPLFFVPLGGSGEIGMNLNLYAYDNRWIMVDCGMMISKGEDESTEHIYVPDPSFLRGKKLIAMVLTHAHEDHIGAIVDLWPQLRCPLYTTPFTAAVIRKRLEEAGLLDAVKLNVCAPGSRVRLDPFSIEFIPITHSTVESQSILIKTPAGSILHTGDWKLDPEPLIGPKTAIARFKSLGNENVLAVVGDSTNAPIKGHSGSESLVKKELSKLIPKEKKRVVCACFSSNIARIATFIEIAKKTDRMVAFVGRSLKRMISAAQETGYLSKDLPIVSPIDAMRLPKHKVLLICTGSQAESKAALSKIAYDQHPEVILSPEDTVFFSFKIILGNEDDIERLHLRLK